MRGLSTLKQQAPTNSQALKSVDYRQDSKTLNQSLSSIVELTPPRSKLPPRHTTTSTVNPSSVKQFRKGPWIVGGLAVYCFTAYGFFLYRVYSRSAEESSKLQIPEDVLDRYDRTARDYDNEVDFAEKAMWLGRLRNSLAKRAYGDVLEVSVGTGRNIKYYDIEKCKSITMVDQSGEMVKIATEKLKELYPQYKDCTFLTHPAEDPIPSPPPSGYDTIVQTMGLCSTPKPSALLQRLGTLANQDHGQILLLEHGRSHYTWLNTILDNLAPHHADRYGCWWNRDIGKIVEESGLEVQKIQRYYLGTTWWVELRPKRNINEELSHREKAT